MKLPAVGIDLGKTVFHLVGLGRVEHPTYRLGNRRSIGLS
jgi:hypothetical protein